MSNIVKGYYFQLEYHIRINEIKDIIGYKLNESGLIQVIVDEECIDYFGEDNYFTFLDEDAYKINDIIVYLEKYTYQYEYYPNKSFDAYEYFSWDIDDFGDTNEGWSNYIEACNQENLRYENSINKVMYEGFICSEDGEVANEILDEIIKEFCMENEIK